MSSAGVTAMPITRRLRRRRADRADHREPMLAQKCVQLSWLSLAGSSFTCLLVRRERGESADHLSQPELSRQLRRASLIQDAISCYFNARLLQYHEDFSGSPTGYQSGLLALGVGFVVAYISGIVDDNMPLETEHPVPRGVA